MTMFFRRLIISCLGLLGGLAAWPLLQILLQYQTEFPSFLVFSLVSGAAFGLVFGAFFSTSEGIILKRLDRFFAGMAIGAAIGAIGGATGFLIAQRVFLFFGERLALSEGELQSIGYPISRALGWAVLGTFVGITEGVRVRSRRKIITGIVGGFLGGLVGGFILELLRLIFPMAASATLIGLVLLGVSIGLAYSFIERRMSFGVFRILNGPHKGKEFILNQDKMSVGSSHRCHVLLTDYEGVESRHANLQTIDRELLLKPASEDQQILVNDIAITERILKFEDVIKIGTVKMLYKHE